MGYFLPRFNLLPEPKPLIGYRAIGGGTNNGTVIHCEPGFVVAVDGLVLSFFV